MTHLLSAYDAPKDDAALGVLVDDMHREVAPKRMIPTADALIRDALERLQKHLTPEQRVLLASDINGLHTAVNLAAMQREQLSACAQALFRFSQLTPIDSTPAKASLVALWWKQSGKPAFEKWQGAS